MKKTLSPPSRILYPSREKKCAITQDSITAVSNTGFKDRQQKGAVCKFL